MRPHSIISKTFFVGLGIVLSLGFRSSVSANEEPRSAARKPVLLLNAALVEVMQKSPALSFGERYDHLSPVLREIFHFPVMTRVATGPFWSALSPAQQKRLVSTFARMSVAMFAARFRRYKGERFEVGGEYLAPRGSVLVQNQLVTSSGKTVFVNYLLRKYGGKWKIVDVLLDAKFSELAIKRSEFTSILQRQGYGGLIRNLEAIIRRLRESGTSTTP